MNFETWTATDVGAALHTLKTWAQNPQPQVWAFWAQGCQINAEGRLEIQEESEIFRQVPAVLQDIVALYALRYSGALDACRRLDLGFYAYLSDLNAIQLASLTQLRQLSLENADIQDIDALAGLKDLEELNLASCKNLERVDALSGLSALQRLDLQHCVGLTTLEPLRGLKRLIALNLSHCTGIRDFSPLSGLVALQRLALPQSPLEAILAMSDLQDLTLTGCTEDVCLDALAGLSMLKQLKFIKNTNIKRLSMVQWPSSLVALSLTMSRIEDLSPLAHATHLKTLDLSQNVSITDLSPLAQLQELNRLALGGCTGLKNIEALFSLKSLRLLNLMGCTGLEEVQLTALKKQLPMCKVIYMSR